MAKQTIEIVYTNGEKQEYDVDKMAFAPGFLVLAMHDQDLQLLINLESIFKIWLTGPHKLQLRDPHAGLIPGIT
jgi:hypothetical protein